MFTLGELKFVCFKFKCMVTPYPWNYAYFLITIA